MGLFINLLFLAISFITLAVAGGFSTNGAVRVTGIPAWDKNPDLYTAHKYLSISATVCWVTVAVIIVGAIVYAIFGAETVELGTLGWADYVVYGLLFLSLAATIGVGILSAIAAQKIAASGVTENNSSRRQAIIAAVLAIVASVAIIAAFLFLFFGSGGKKKDETSKTSELQTLALLA